MASHPDQSDTGLRTALSGVNWSLDYIVATKQTGLLWIWKPNSETLRMIVLCMYGASQTVHVGKRSPQTRKSNVVAIFVRYLTTFMEERPVKV